MWLAARVGVWVCALPVRLRGRRFTALLRDEAAVSRVRHVSRAEVDGMVQVVLRVCRLPLFATRVFPRSCLRESLAVYHVVRRSGYPACLHLGVQKDHDSLTAHSWVTLQGEPLIPASADPRFRTIYSYPLTGQTSPEDQP
jgi:hypothetical protein